MVVPSGPTTDLVIWEDTAIPFPSSNARSIQYLLHDIWANCSTPVSGEELENWYFTDSSPYLSEWNIIISCLLSRLNHSNLIVRYLYPQTYPLCRIQVLLYLQDQDNNSALPEQVHVPSGQPNTEIFLYQYCLIFR